MAQIIMEQKYKSFLILQITLSGWGAWTKQRSGDWVVMQHI